MNFATKQYHGSMIVVEGIDGSGKTTIAKRLAELMNVNYTRQPGGSEFSERLRHSCLNEDVSKEVQTLFYSALIVDGIQKSIVPKLEKGETVICDRYFGTTFCYQGLAVDNHSMVLNVLEPCTRIVRPELTLYLSLPLSKAIERESGQGRCEDRYSKMQLIEKERIKEAYDLLYKAETETNHFDIDDPELNTTIWNARGLVTKKSVIIDATKDIDSIVDSCYQVIQTHLNHHAAV